MDSVTFEIPGPIKGKGRPRATKTGIIYTPKETVQYENLVKMCFRDSANTKFFESPLEASITAYYEIPKSTTKKNREAMILGKILPTKKPDIDNIAKIILDSLNGIAYKDDAQIVRCVVTKLYSKCGMPRVEVTIRKAGGGNYADKNR